MAGWDTEYSAPGLFMGRIGRIKITCMTSLVSGQDFATYLELLARDIDQRSARQQLAVLNHAPDYNLTPERRHALGLVLKARADKLRAITAAYAMVTPSFIVRGGLKAIWWVAPPPYPCRVTGTPREAFDYLATFLPGESADLLSDRYSVLLRHLPWMGDVSQRAAG